MKVLKSHDDVVSWSWRRRAARRLPTAEAALVNVTGDWVGAWTCDYVGDGNGVVVLGLTQDGARVTGTRARDQFEIQPRVQRR